MLKFAYLFPMSFFCCVLGVLYAFFVYIGKKKPIPHSLFTGSDSYFYLLWPIEK